MVPLFPLVLEPARIASSSAIALANIAYLGIITSVVAYLLWFYALSRLEASRVAVFANLQPPATAVAAWLILGDPITWEIVAGGVLVVLGVRVAQRR
jgi:drug/metabolite transporter (DMT)-like permease